MPRSRTSASSASRDLRIVLVSLIVALIGEGLGLVFVYLPARRQEVLRATESLLTAVAADREATFRAWVIERIGDAKTANEFFAEASRNQRFDDPVSAQSAELLQLLASNYGYEAAYLLDDSGRVKLATRGARAAGRCTAEFFHRANAAAGPIIEFCLDDDGRPKIFTASAFDYGRERRRAVTLFVTDPCKYIYPMLATWTIATRTGEIQIGRFEGEMGVSLSPTRNRKIKPLVFRRPARDTALGAKKLKGMRTLRAYGDYRNVRAFVVTRWLPGTRWLLLVKVDADEALAPPGIETRRLALLFGLGTMLVASAAFLILRSRRVRSLRIAEDHFRRLFDNSTSGIIVLELIFDAERRPVDHRVVSLNPAAEALIGLDAPAVVGKTSAEVPMVQWPPDVTTRNYAVALTGKPVHYEDYNPAVGLWLDTRVFSPQPGQIAHIFTNITERKRHEESLRALSESSVLGVFSYENNRLTFVNDAFAEIYGYTRDELLGADPMIVVDPQDRDQVTSYIRERVDGGVRGDTYEFRARRKDGAARWIEAYVTRVDLAGRVILTGTIIDITDRVASEAELRRLALGVSQLTEGIVIMDRQRVIEYVNPAFERLTGFSREDAIGHEWPLHKSDLQDESVYTNLSRTLDAGERWEGFLIHRRKDGTPFQQEVSITPVRDPAGSITNFVAVKRDVTRERSLIAQLYQSQKMEAVGTLAGGVAHDFNNLLMGMSLMLHSASRSPESPEKVATTLVQLEKLVKRGSSLTKQLLLFSRKEVARPELLDLNGAVRDASALLRRLVRENIQFSLELSDEILSVTVDPAQIEQAMVNLVVNAADAMPKGGKIRVATGRNADGDCWLIVDDTGHGIPQAIRDRIFEPFFTTKGRDKGTGLGLSVVHGIVTEHGGTVALSDAPGGGTRFCITLPATAIGDDDDAVLIAEEPLPGGRGERVLIIEDEETVRAGLLEMLRSLDYRPIAVGGGEEALALPAEVRADLVLSDVVLPDAFGPELVDQLRYRWPEMKTVLMSGYTNDSAVRERAAAGMVLLLDKPFDLRSLAVTLRAALDH